MDGAKLRRGASMERTQGLGQLRLFGHFTAALEGAVELVGGDGLAGRDVEGAMQATFVRANHALDPVAFRVHATVIRLAGREARRVRWLR